MSSVPVLLYHHVAPDREVTPEAFEAQLGRLREEGCRALSLEELLLHATGRQEAPEGSIAITFDDGYADNWIYAFPLLEKHGLKACCFVPTAFIPDSESRRPTSKEGGAVHDTVSREREPEGFLTWGELKAMAESGVFELGSHTHTHRGFARRSPYGDPQDELARSRKLVEERTGWPCRALAWPWGDYEEEWLPLVREAGYRLAFTTRPGGNPPGRDPLRIRRFKVRDGSAEWLARRLWLYRRVWLGELYGRLQGLERRIKSG